MQNLFELINVKTAAIFGAILFALTIFLSLFEFTSPSKMYTIQPYSGGEPYTIVGGGIKYVGFSKIYPSYKELNVQTIVPEDTEARGGPIELGDDDNVFRREANGFSFNDKIGTWLESAVTALATGDENYTRTVINKRDEEVIVETVLLPLIRNIQGNIVKLYSTEDWISGAKAPASEMFYDQLLNGPYVIIENPDYNLSTSQEALSTRDSITLRNKTNEQQYIISRDAEGNPIRSQVPGLADYGYTVTSAVITDEEFHSEFEANLQETRKIQAKVQEAKQKIEEQIALQRLNEEQGEADKIRQRKLREKEEIEKVIAAQTAVQEAQYKLEAERLNTQAAELKAKQNKLLEQAGIPAEEKLKLELDAQVRMANAIFGGTALSNVQTYAPGGSNGNDQGTFDELLKILLFNNMNKK